MGMSPGSEIIEIGGIGIERDVLGVIEEIQRRWPELRVQYLDPSHFSDPGDAPWRIVEDCKDGQVRLVCQVWELDRRLLDRLHAADMHNPDFLKNLDAQNIAARMNIQRRFDEARAEAMDITQHVIKSPKGRYTIPTYDGDGVVKIDDTAPSERIK